jgi:segregation and condensation protein B
MVNRTAGDWSPAELPDDADSEGISLEELGAAYAEAIAQSEVLDPRLKRAPSPEAEPDQSAVPGWGSGSRSFTASGTDKSAEGTAAEADDDPLPSPTAIVEAALFIGNPENRGLSEAELAALMRDVTPEDINRYVDQLNAGYQTNGQALRIHRDEDGLRMGVAPDMETVRRAFYGKIRESRLSQAAIEVLSLVAYQPGITAEKVQDQRGKESVSLLSQLVRRRLLEQRRLQKPGEKRATPVYFPTERFLQLFQIRSLEDLPHVEP